MNTFKSSLDTLDAIIDNLENALTDQEKNDVGHQQNGKPITTAQNTATKKKKEKKPKPQPKPALPIEATQFLQCDLRVGKVLDVSHHPEADGLFVLKISYGAGLTRTVCAGLRKFLSDEQMADRMVVTICNLKPKKLRGIASEAMVLAASTKSGEGQKETVEPIAPPEHAQEGMIVSAQHLEGERTVQDGKFVSAKTWDKVIPRLLVKDGNACYDGRPLLVGEDNVRCSLADGAEIH